MSAFVVASDLGSSGCKTVVVGADGHVRAAALRDYPTRHPRDGWCEQDPADWVEAVLDTAARAVGAAGIAPGEVAALGLVGVTHNAVLLDAADRVLRPSILLFDTRSEPQCAAIEARFGTTVFARTRNTVTPIWTWPQLMWVREHEPDIFVRIARVLFQKDHVRHAIAPGPVTDSIDAAGSLLYDPVAGAWVDDFVDDLGLPPGALPEVVASTDSVAALSGQAASRIGLLAGTPVIAGTTDTVAEVLGAGALSPGQGTVKLASVGRVTCVASAPLDHPMALNYRHVLDPLWYPGTAIKHASTALRWLRDATGGPDFTTLSDEAGAVPPGSHGVLFHPYLNGEWAPFWDSRLRASFLGLTMAHGRGHAARAVMEGVAFALRDAVDFAEDFGLHAREFRLLGGGSVSPAWAQILTDVLERPLILPAERDAAYGAALITGMGAGLFPRDAKALSGLIRTAGTCQPRPDVAERYRALHAIHRDAAAALAPLSHRLSAFARAEPAP
jgi:xylulokinase